jgi:DNA repair exonuclease SbcCD ATPase subunit
MARKGITYDMVCNAAAAIKARGTDPTISAIRVELNNEGSFSTISQHLAKWREMDAEKVDVSSLPEAVENAALETITKLWNIATKEAREEIAAIKEDYNQQRKQLQTDLDALLNSNKVLEETLEHEIAVSEKDRAKVKEAEKKLTAVSSELDTYKRLYNELTATLKPPSATARKAADTKSEHPATPKAGPENKPAEPPKPAH